MSLNLGMEGEAGPNVAQKIYEVTDVIPPELLARTVPAVVNVNMNQSTGLHVGPKFEFVTVTQIVEDRESNRANRPSPDRDIVKKKKRHWIGLCWAIVILGMLLTVAFIIHLVIIARSLLPEEAPWRVSREMWDSAYFHYNETLDNYRPIKLVIIHHTVTPDCFNFESCAAAMRNLQDYFLTNPNRGWDLPYNFVVGNDGRVYDSRLWNGMGAHTILYNRCSIGIAFMGDYREGIQASSRVTDLQMSRLRMLLQEGVDQGHLRRDYSVVGANNLLNTLSPGEKLYKAIQSLEHFGRTNFRGLTCDEIYKY